MVEFREFKSTIEAIEKYGELVAERGRAEAWFIKEYTEHKELLCTYPGDLYRGLYASFVEDNLPTPLLVAWEDLEAAKTALAEFEANRGDFIPFDHKLKL